MNTCILKVKAVCLCVAGSQEEQTWCDVECEIWVSSLPSLPHTLFTLDGAKPGSLFWKQNKHKDANTETLQMMSVIHKFFY